MMKQRREDFWRSPLSKDEDVFLPSKRVMLSGIFGLVCTMATITARKEGGAVTIWLQLHSRWNKTAFFETKFVIGTPELIEVIQFAGSQVD